MHAHLRGRFRRQTSPESFGIMGKDYGESGFGRTPFFVLANLPMVEFLWLQKVGSRYMLCY